MQNDPGNVLAEFEDNREVYATFWQRLLALFIDGLVLSPIVFLDWYNKSHWKSPAVLVAISIAALVYKPLLEFKYGATVGKMALKILVVNNNFNKPSLMNVVLRSMFDIVDRIIILIATLLVFNMPEFATSSSIDEFAKLQATIINISITVYIPTAIMLIEIIFLLSDKRRRSLHDRIGETYVINR